MHASEPLGGQACMSRKLSGWELVGCFFAESSCKKPCKLMSMMAVRYKKHLCMGILLALQLLGGTSKERVNNKLELARSVLEHADNSKHSLGGIFYLLTELMKPQCAIIPRGFEKADDFSDCLTKYLKRRFPKKVRKDFPFSIDTAESSIVNAS
jgi:hypothetical protein